MIHYYFQKLILIIEIYKTQILSDAFNYRHDQQLNIQNAIHFIISIISLIPKSKGFLLLSSNVPEELEVPNKIVWETFKLMILSIEEIKKSFIQNDKTQIQIFIRFYCKIGKKFILSILLNKELYVLFFENLLFMFKQKNSDENIEEMVQFWIKMINCVDQQRDIIFDFLQLFEQIIKLLIDKCQLPLQFYLNYGNQVMEIQEDNDTDINIFNRSNDEQLEIKFNCRLQSEEIIKEFQKIINPKDILVVITQIIKAQNILEVINYSDHQFSQLPSKLQQTLAIFESCINQINIIMDGISTSYHSETKTYQEEIVQLYLSLNIQHPFIISQILQNLSKGGANMLSNQLLKQVFKFVYSHLCSKEYFIQRNATLVFYQICCKNQQFVNDNIANFCELLNKMQNILHFYNIVKGVTAALCQNQIQLQNNLVQICSIFVQNISHQNQNDTQMMNTIRNLDYLSEIFSSIVEQQFKDLQQLKTLIIQIYRDIWPILFKLIEYKSPTSYEIIEKIIKLTKFVWRCTQDSFPLDFFIQIFERFLQVYEMVPISSFIYAADISVTIFYLYSLYRETLIQIFERVCKITFLHLPKFCNLEGNPELSEDFFGFLARYCKYTPNIIMRSMNIDKAILHLSMMGIGIEHKLVAKSLYAWLETFCKLFWKSIQDQTLKEYVEEDIRIGLLGEISPLIEEIFKKLMKAIKDRQGDQVVVDYMIDALLALMFVEKINIGELVQQFWSEQQGILSEAEIREWVSVSRKREYNQKWMKKQEEWLRLLVRRCNQIGQRK